MEAKASFRRSGVRVLFSSNRSNSSERTISPFFSTENQEWRLIKTSLDLILWFQPKLVITSFLICLSSEENEGRDFEWKSSRRKNHTQK